MGQLTDIPKRIWANEMFRMLFIAAGIMICFLYFGIMQEKIMRGCFGGELTDGKCVNGEKFTFEITLVGVLAVVYAIVGRGMQSQSKLMKLKIGAPLKWLLCECKLPVECRSVSSCKVNDNIRALINKLNFGYIDYFRFN